MTIRSVIILISAVIYLLLAALLVPFYYLNSTVTEINYALRHAEQEHIAIKNLVISVGRELREISDFVYFGDDELTESTNQVDAAFRELRKFTFVLHTGEEDIEKAEVNEAKLYQNINKEYQEILSSRAKILSLHQEGKKEEALAELVNVLELTYEKNFLPLTEAWMEAEREELNELEDELQSFSDAYRLNLGIAAGSTLVILLFLFYLLNRIVTRRLQVLVDATREVSRGDLHSKVEVVGNDEIALLTRAFNEMTGKLGASQTRLLEQCYLAGLNNASTDVLHNVRGSFTGLTLGFEQLQAKLNDIKGSGDQKEKIEDLRANVARMEQKITDVNDILLRRDQKLSGDESMQRYYLRDLINDSINLLGPEHLEKVKFYIDPVVSTLGKILTHRIVFIQILSNLFTNGCEAILSSAVNNGLLRISAMVEKKDGLNFIHIFVTDNGEGIVSDDIERIFERNFSKKSKFGLTGLGLHWCSNAAVSLNGSIYAESGGKDKGATFHLLLPTDND